MITVISEVDQMPLGVLKRGKPRPGDTIYIDDVPHDVVEADRDMVTVRSPNAPIPMQRSRFQENPGVSRMSGFKRNNAGYDKDLPFKKYEQGPIYPSELSRPSYSVPSGEPHFQQTPHWAPPASAGYQWPWQQPVVYTVVHYKYFVPLFKVERYTPPQPGAREQMGGEIYTYVKVDGTTVFARPDRHWNYAVIAISKDTGQGIIFMPCTHRREISAIKQRLKHYLMNKKGIPRREYHMKYIKFHQITTYMTNGRSPKYIR